MITELALHPDARGRLARVVFPVTCLASALALSMGQSAAQPPPVQMLADLWPGIYEHSSDPQSFTEIAGNELLFTAFQTGSRRLWKTDGTPAGTVWIPAPTGPGELARVGNVAVYGRNGELWASDGTQAGTQQIASVEVVEFPRGWDGARRRPFGAPGMVFAGRDGSGDLEPWVTGGTAGSTMRLADLVPGTTGSDVRDLYSIEWSDGTTTRDLTFFSASTPTTGRELWVTEGTAATTQRVTDLQPGAASGIDDTEVVAWVRPPTFDLYVAFRGETAATGSELFRVRRKWSGSSFTMLGAAEIEVGTRDADPRELVLFGTDVVCAAENLREGRELWTMNILTGQVALVEVENGSAGSSPTDLLMAPRLPRRGEAVYFSASTAFLGRELYAWDGSSVQRLTDLNPGIRSSNPVPLATMAGRLWLRADNGQTGTELWSCDGLNVTLGWDVNPGPGSSDPTEAVVFDPGTGPMLVFSADAGGFTCREPHAVDAAGRTILLADVVPYAANSSTPGLLCTLSDGRIAFHASNSTSREVWVTDGTAVTPVLTPGSVGFIAPAALALDDGTFVFAKVQTNPLNPTENFCSIWRSDATATDATLLGTTLTPGTSAYPFGPGSFVEWKGQIYFDLQEYPAGGNLRSSIWRTSRTGGLTRVFGPPAFEDAYAPTPVGDRLFFGGRQNGDTELWVMPVGGTPSPIDINPTGSSSPRGLIAFRKRCFFTADDGVSGRELWKSLGVPSNTEMVVDAWPGPNSGTSGGLTSTGNALFFVATDGIAGRELWMSNGFTARMVADLNPGPGDSLPSSITAVHLDRVACSAWVPSIGSELWLVDTQGNAQSFDLRPGPSSSAPIGLHWTSRYLLFTAEDDATGREPWYADGIDFNTVGQIADIAPGPASSFPYPTSFPYIGRLFAAAGSLALFGPNDQGVAGSEPWVIDLGAGSYPVGESCPPPDSTFDLRATAPLLGSRLTYWAYEPGPAPSVVFLSTVPSAPLVGITPCPLQIDLTTAQTVETIIQPLPGGYVRGLPLPGIPALAGGRLRMQILQVPSAGTYWMTNGLELVLGF